MISLANRLKRTTGIIHALFMLGMITTSSGSLADALMRGISEGISEKTQTTSSKKLEDLFNSPVSISVIEASQIKNAGITSIPEALRLVPGAIVLEQTNGQYEVYLRGFQNTPSRDTLTQLSNRLALVMVDERTVYNHFNGGTFWESLPLHIDDVERIEVIRGASSALYGSNAVTGVIHIITKRAQGLPNTKASVTAGSNNTKVAHFAINETWKTHAIRFSGFHDQRERYQDTYYNTADQTYGSIDAIMIGNRREGYKKTDLARDIKGFQLSAKNDPNQKLSYDATLSHENSEVQKVHLNLPTPFSYNHSQSQAANLKLRFDDWEMRTSYQRGEHQTAGLPELDHDFAILQSTLEYEIRLPQWILRPGLSVEDADYDGVYIGGERHIRTNSYMLRSEYAPTQSHRIIAALRYDDYNIANDNYLSYQILGTYTLDSDTIIRGGISTANQSAFMINAYTQLQFISATQNNVRLDFTGDQNTKLAKITTYELGLRHDFSFNSSMDIELFQSKLKDQTTFVPQSPYIDPPYTVFASELEALPTTATQQGITADWHYEQINWNLNIYLTWQDTDLKKQFTELSAQDFDKNEHHSSVPKLYGGINANWQPEPLWNLNVQGYYLDNYTLDLESDKGSSKSPSNFILNLTAKRTFNRWVDSFISFKNLFNHGKTQYFNTDQIDPMILFGINLKFDH